MSVQYNDNILIVDEPLADDEYYALIVKGLPGLPSDFHRKDYFDLEKGWIGLECTSNQQIYISKSKPKRTSVLRGETVKVRVKDKTKCCELS